MNSRLYIYGVVALLVISMGWLLSRSLFSPQEATDFSKPDGALVNYVSPSGLWSAKFSHEPKYSTNVFRDDIGLPTVTLEGATLDQGNELYLVRLYHFHDQESPDLKKFLEGILKTWKTKFPSLSSLSIQNSQFRDQPALSFIFVGQNLEMRGEIFKMSDYIYLLGWVGNMTNKELERVADSHFSTLLNSFNPTPITE